MEDTPAVVTRPTCGDERVRVQLGLDRGTVSFFHAVHMTHVYTDVNMPGEKLRPHFLLGEAGDGEPVAIELGKRPFMCEKRGKPSVLHSRVASRAALWRALTFWLL